MEKQYKSIISLRGHVTKAIQCLADAIDKEAQTCYLDILKGALDKKWAKYDDKWDDFCDSHSTKDGHDDKENAHDMILDNYHDVQLKLSSYLVTLPTNAPQGQQTNSTPRSNVKMPEVKLKDFSGDPLEWTRFWSQFNSSIHSKSDIDDVTKYIYLNQCLKGNAQKILSGFKGEVSDYEDAVKALQDMYGDQNRIRRTLIRSLLNLTKPRYVRSEIFTFKIELENLMTQLSHDPQIDLDGHEMFLREIIALKLPDEVEEYLFNRYNTIYFTVDEIKEGLKNLLSYMKPDGKGNHSSEKSYQSHKSSNNRSNHHNKHNSSPQSSNKSSAVGTYSTLSNYSCIFCKSNHRPSECATYSTVSARRERLKELKRCTKCAKAHGTADCNTTIVVCPNCKKGKHHSFLCVIPSTSTNSNTSASNSSGANDASSSNASDASKLQGDPVANNQVKSLSIIDSKSKINYSVALPTATVGIRSDNGQAVKVRCFFDSGSQRSFIHKDLANQLGLKNIANLNMTLDSFDNAGVTKGYEIVKPIVSLGNRKKKVTMAVVSQMPQQVVTPGLHDTAIKLSDMGYALADQQINSDVVEDIQILIGSDFLGRFVSGLTTVNNVDLYESPGGYLIYGIIPQHNSSNSSTRCNTALIAKVSVQSFEVSPLITEPRNINSCVVHEALPVHKLWDLDVVGINPVQESPEESKILSQYNSTVRHADGRYWVELPFKHDHPYLPTNHKLALGQMYNQIKRFEHEPELLSCYDSIIQEQLQLGFIEEVSTPVSPSTHYLPHHAVRKDSSTTPIRIVYNCSAKAGKASASLNECLMTGPSLTEKLSDSLLKFRSNKFACVADIEKAFLQVGLQSHHRDFTRFLWLEDPFDKNSTVKTYRFKSVLFGATCSPFLLQMTLQHHFDQSNSPYADVLSSSFYDDNLQFTLDEEQELINIYNAANNELGIAGMTLRQWNTNSSLLKNHICDNSDDSLEFPKENKVLGLIWEVSGDTLSLSSCQFEPLEYVTKRQLLSLVSTCFDPLGMCTPILIKGKLLIQSAWKEQVGWDVHLPPVYLSKWYKLAQEISELPSFKFPRCVCLTSEQYVLHIFVDASTSAYGAVCYLSNGATPHFVASKSRVAPFKTRTLPQLELTALQLGTQFACYIKQIFNHCIYNVIIWSDSEVALQWIRNNNSKIVYVQNRVANIKELGSSFKFLHVPSGENPADLITRGISIKQFKANQTWIHGPSWLPYSERWPEQKPIVVVYEIVSENIPEVSAPELPFDYTMYSSLGRLLSITKFIFQFIKKIKSDIVLPDPLVYWIRQVQRTHYPRVCAFLRKEIDTVDNEINQFVRDLGLYHDESSGIVHSRGRLQHSNLDQEAKFPILIPTKSHLAYLLINFVHQKCLHGGVRDTLALARQHYWMPKALQTIKSILRQCLVCKRVAGRRFDYPGPPPLPAERVQFSRPFKHVGVDYSGPITITRTDTGQPHKYYVALFTCTASRLVHLELASNMSATTFINMFRRFSATYSQPVSVISDNGTNFRASAKFFETMLKNQNVIDYMSDNRISWKFIAPRAPWQGGFYEIMIGLVKSCLRKVLFRKRVNHEELETVLKEIQCKLNNRPLTYMDMEGPIMHLAPIHLHCGRVIDPLPAVEIDCQEDPVVFDHNDLNLKYTQVSTIINSFTKIWKAEYLTALRMKHYGGSRSSQDNSPKEGEVVIVERSGPQHEWPLGRIKQVYPDSEGIIRAVDVMCDGTVSRRTVDKLVPLEIQFPCVDLSEEPSDKSQTISEPPQENEHSELVRPTRQAARRAAELRRVLIDSDQL